MMNYPPPVAPTLENPDVQKNWYDVEPRVRNAGLLNRKMANKWCR